MANDVWVKLAGEEHLLAALREMDAVMSGTYLLAAVERGAEIPRQVASDLAPRVQPENVRDPDNTPEKLAASIKMETVASDSHRAEVAVGTRAPQGLWNEVGTVNMGAQPFLRPAFDETKDSVIDQIGETLQRLIETSITPTR